MEISICLSGNGLDANFILGLCRLSNILLSQTVTSTPPPPHPLPPPPPQKVSGFTRFRKVTLKSSGGVRTPGPPGQLRACLSRRKKLVSTFDKFPEGSPLDFLLFCFPRWDASHVEM